MTADMVDEHRGERVGIGCRLIGSRIWQRRAEAVVDAIMGGHGVGCGELNGGTGGENGRESCGYVAEKLHDAM